MHAPSEPAEETGTVSSSGPGAATAETPARIDRRFGRERRLSRSAEFREAFDQRRKTVGQFMVLWLRSGPGASLRMGVVASRRSFRRAVDRNRAKRLLREAWRLQRFRFGEDADVVLLAKRNILKATRQDVEHDLLQAATQAGLLTK